MSFRTTDVFLIYIKQEIELWSTDTNFLCVLICKKTYDLDHNVTDILIQGCNNASMRGSRRIEGTCHFHPQGGLGR